MAPDAPWLLSVSSGAILPPSCRAWLCGHCGPRKAVRLGRALDHAGYDFAFTATRAPADLRQGVARMRHRIAKHGPWEWCWSAERGPKTGMIHVHACVRGSRRSHRVELSPAARRAGFGFVWVTASDGHRFGDYAAKMGRYSAKQLVDYASWRELNGSRPWHWSRGYTGGVPMREWVPQHAPARDPGPWRVIPARELVAMEELRAAWRADGERRAEVWFREVYPTLKRIGADALPIDRLIALLDGWDVTGTPAGQFGTPRRGERGR